MENNKGAVYHLCKLLPIGNSGVGKSCLVLRFADDTFTHRFISTIGIDFKIKYVKLGSEVIKIQLWDMTGQERFRSVPTPYYRGVHGFLVVFDVTDTASFEAVDKWMLNIKNFASIENPYVILVGSKCDLESLRVIEFETAKQKADSLGIDYMEISSKLSINVEEVVIKVVAEIQHKRNENIHHGN